jgi:tetratricopeptide (TPR) repeat protein
MHRKLTRSILLVIAMRLACPPPLHAFPPPAVAAAADDEPLAVKDWSGLARDLAGAAMDQYRARMGTLQHKVRPYREQVRYEAAVEPIDLAAFLALPTETQQQRRELAEPYLEKAQRFEVVLRQAANLRRQGFAHGSPSGVAEGLTRFLGALVNATGLDPSDPAIWYDLAFAQGTVGDLAAHERSLNAALAAMAPLPARRYAGLRRRVLLDQAWLCRERGLDAEGLERIASARAIEASDEVESMLVEGLLLAESGQFSEACRLAAELRVIRVHVPNWGWLDSDFAERWIKSTAYRARGELRLASFVMGRVYGYYSYPHAHRFFADVGLLCELNGQPDLAREYYALATLLRPLMTYFPVETLVGPARIFGLGDLDYPYAVAYGGQLVAGSRLAHAAQLVMACDRETDPERRRQLGETAIAELTICHRRGIRPAEALALRGRAFHHLGDTARAADDLALACDLLTAQGQDSPDVCSLAAILEVSRGGYERALPRLTRHLSAHPGDAAGWNALGVTASHAGQAETAREAFGTVVGIAPDDVAGWYNRGLLNFHERNWTAACADLEVAVRLAPDLAEVRAILDRARRAGAAAAAATVPGADPAPASEPPAWSPLTPANGAFDDEAAPDPVAQMYSNRVFEGLVSTGGSRESGEAAGSPSDLRDVVRALEQAHANDPTRSNCRDLALAYVRSGEPAKGRELLLPRWTTGIDPGEMCVVLEADRALGDAGRARDILRQLREEPSGIADPYVWSLVAFICFDAGLNEEGLTALDQAIGLDPDNQPLKMQRQFYDARP